MARSLPTMLMLVLSASLARAQAAREATPTLKAKTRIVVIDVVVTDKQGRLVRNLQAADFALAENGAAQTIHDFEAHTSLSSEDAAKLAPMPKLDANIFTNYTTAPGNSPLTVLIFDALNTKMMDQAVVLKQMLKYLDTPHPGVRMELFELNDGLKLLQGFTSDPAVLRAALLSRKAAPQASKQMDNAVSDEGTEITRVDQGLVGLGEQTAMGLKRGARPGQDLSMNRSSQAGFQLWNRQLATLDAMGGLARYMGGLSGRKNLLWFSSSFMIPKTWSAVTDKLHETMALLGRSQVAVYPIVAYGLMPNLDTQGSPLAFSAKIDSRGHSGACSVRELWKFNGKHYVSQSGSKSFTNSIETSKWETF